jgi:methylphosphotriester-DNA--protein-cysteine methyltransferase
MIRHIDLGPTPFARLRMLNKLINSGEVSFGGHRPGRLYGRLVCRTGKRMKVENRVFFKDEIEAIEHGYRPCAVCLPEKYKEWKNE